MFHRQKSDQDSDVQKNESNDSQGGELTARQNDEAGNAQEAPDVKIPPATGLAGQRRIGVRVAGGETEAAEANTGNADTKSKAEDKKEESHSEQQAEQKAEPQVKQKTARPFNGFNRLQPQVQRHQQNTETTQISENKETSETTQEEDKTVNIQQPGQAQDQNQGEQAQTQTQAGGGIETSVSAGSQLIVGNGISLTGEIQECNHLVVEGRVEAALRGSKVLEIKQGGTFIGSVEIEEATIAGTFEGEITVNGRLTITQTGSITGTVSYKELEIQAGAKLDGKVSPITGSKFKAETGKTQAQNQAQADTKIKAGTGKADQKGDAASKKKDAELPLTQDA